ncbi:DUF6887 family protein [Floridanema evergladense]|uniref:Uncharacterized protein n=1 Tax=Floridaenema evergladense BLCC-F167 TaxID=3153639 RepID=A0ABV4WE36_9CYAN
MKPNFEAMSRKELREYVLAHRDDDDAFYALMDRIYQQPNKTWFPAPKSIDDLKHFPELLEQHRQRKQEQE